MLCLMLLWILSGNETWKWPLDAQWGVSASFGEYRGERVHTGLDFSTGGVEGRPVKPARAGTVYQVRSTNRGYGKVIYMSHTGGYTTVYAHLADFGPKLKQAIRDAGSDPDGLFENLQLKLALSADELLAYTGESGAGMPHLHFEVRDSKNQPLDPLDLPFPPLTSRFRAKFSGFVLTPEGEGASVNGMSHGSVEIHEQARSVRASGKLGVKVLALLGGPRGNRLGCRGIRLFLDDELVGSWLPRKMTFDFNRNGSLVHDRCWSGLGPTRFAYSFDGREAYLPSIPGYEGKGLIEVTKRATLATEIMEMDGRWQRFELVLDPQGPKIQVGPGLSDPLQATSLSLNANGRYLLFRANELEGNLQLPDKLVGVAAGGEVEMAVEAAMQPAEVVWITSAGKLSRLVGALPQGSAFTYQMGNWHLKGEKLPDWPAQALFQGPPDLKHGDDTISFHSRILCFGRAGLPAEGLTVSYRDENLPEHVGVFYWDFTKQRWRFLDRLDREVAVPYLAPLVIAQDLRDPVVMAPKVHPYFTGKRVVIPVRDKGSGIDEDTIALRHRQGEVPFLYDSDRGWLILPVDAGRGPWDISLADRTGRAVQVSGLKR